MPVLKNKTQGLYVNVSKNILTDHKLSLKDRGLLITLLSLPDNWDYSLAGLEKILPDGKAAIQTSMNHLIELGYVSKLQTRTSKGKFGGNDIEVHEKPIQPLAENPSTDNPVTEKPVTDFQSQLSNNKVNNNKLINKESETLSEEDYKYLVIRFGKELVDKQINKIQTKNYRNCMNKETIEKWCLEKQKITLVEKPKNKFTNFKEREYEDFESLKLALIESSIIEQEKVS